MRTVRYACIALLAALVVAAPASADEVLVLGKDGRARERDDRHLTATKMPRPRAGAVATAAQRKKKKLRTVAGELKRLRDTGLITPEDYAARRAFYDEVKRQARTLSGLRKTEMRGVLDAVEGIAARRLHRLRLRNFELLRRHGLADQEDAVRPAWHRALEHEQVVLGVHAQDFHVAHGHAIGAHVTAHPHALHDTRRIRRGANRSRSAMEHRSVRRASASEVVPLDDALEALAAAGANDVDAFAVGEDRHVHLIARLHRIASGRLLHLAHDARGRHTGLLEVSLRGLVLFRRPSFDEPDLHGLVAVALRRLHLRDDTRASLEHGRRMHGAVGVEQLRHPDFLAEESCDHGYFPCSLPNALISTSTPAGRSSFISASTVCGVGSKMSMSRLCVRISNCSRDFLSTCGERSTVHRLRDVGSGIGPASRAPVRFAVSTISPVDWSRIRESVRLQADADLV